MLTKLYGSAVFGISAVTITIEVHIALGIGYHLVGMPDNAVKESHYICSFEFSIFLIFQVLSYYHIPLLLFHFQY